MTLWIVANAALAQVVVGADMGGADLVLTNGEVLQGTFTNVGAFIVPDGVNVRVDPQHALEVYAVSVQIAGTLDASGSGLNGGDGGDGTLIPGDDGGGPGGGDGGDTENGWCGGGAGAGHGGQGGQGNHYYATATVAAGGDDVGALSGGRTDVMDFGSGGGGGASYNNSSSEAAPGGAGGGAIRLVADTMDITGEIHADGATPDEAPSLYGCGGGGGAGGTVILDARLLTGDGTVSAKGGKGGDAWQTSLSVQSGGGGGGGGRIKVWYGFTDETLQFEVSGGGVGKNGSTSVIYQIESADGGEGTVYQEIGYPDADGDGANTDIDNCPLIANDQLDTDGDGDGDPCDICPNDPAPDIDGDGVCGASDICRGGDDHLDADSDGQPDFCDCDPLDPLAQTGADEFCDGVDNNCDGVVDPRGAVDGDTYYLDGDGDGYGTEDFSILACGFVDNYVTQPGDCEDNYVGINPDSAETCGDDFDNNCDGTVNEGCADLDIEDTDPVTFGCNCDNNGANPASGALVVLAAAAALRRRRKA